MIPTREELVAAYAFLARRQKLEDRARRSPHPIPLPLVANTVAIDAALRSVNELIGVGIHTAAALLYSFARHPRCFPLALNAMTTVLAKNAALAEGMHVNADATEIRDMVMGVTSQKFSADDVDAWVRDRLVPIHPPE